MFLKEKAYGGRKIRLFPEARTANEKNKWAVLPGGPASGKPASFRGRGQYRYMALPIKAGLFLCLGSALCCFQEKEMTGKLPGKDRTGLPLGDILRGKKRG